LKGAQIGVWRALFPERLGSRVFAVGRDSFFDLASGDLHDIEGVADHVGRGPFGPLGPVGIRVFLQEIV